MATEDTEDTDAVEVGLIKSSLVIPANAGQKRKAR